MLEKRAVIILIIIIVIANRHFSGQTNTNTGNFETMRCKRRHFCLLWHTTQRRSKSNAQFLFDLNFFVLFGIESILGTILLFLARVRRLVNGQKCASREVRCLPKITNVWVLNKEIQKEGESCFCHCLHYANFHSFFIICCFFCYLTELHIKCAKVEAK